MSGSENASRVCEECGEGIDHLQASARYCGKKCQARAWDRRRRRERGVPERQRNMCALDGCGRFVVARGLCNSHHQLAAKWGLYEYPGYLQAILRDPCAYCGGAEAGQFDHVHPRGRNGAGGWTNLAAACPTCNPAKGDRSLLGFLLTKRVEVDLAAILAERTLATQV